MTQEETENLNRHKTSIEINVVFLKTLPTNKKVQKQVTLLMNSNKHLNKNQHTKSFSNHLENIKEK
jgi:hypothetical protein